MKGSRSKVELTPCFPRSSPSCHLTQYTLITCSYYHLFALVATGTGNVSRKATAPTSALHFLLISHNTEECFRNVYNTAVTRCMMEHLTAPGQLLSKALWVSSGFCGVFLKPETCWMLTL